jgi:hypothetical protein
VNAIRRNKPKAASPQRPQVRHDGTAPSVRTGPATPQGRAAPKLTARHDAAAAAAAARPAAHRAAGSRPLAAAAAAQRQIQAHASARAHARVEREPAGSGVDPAEWARLQGIQQRIEALIGGYTHGASRRPSFLRHFDRDRAPPATLASAGSGGGGGGGQADAGESTVQLAEQEAKRDRDAFLSL